MLSSIRAPRTGTRDRQPEPWALEAKEFLRWVLPGCVWICVPREGAWAAADLQKQAGRRLGNIVSRHPPLPPRRPALLDQPFASPPVSFRRQRLIGREVSVSMEYNRKVPPTAGEAAGRPAAEERTMAFGTVTVSEGAGAEQKVGRQGWGAAGRRVEGCSLRY